MLMNADCNDPLTHSTTVLNKVDKRAEVYEMEDVVGLSAERSLENAQNNYASHAAGELVWVGRYCGGNTNG